jgi:hypothetical protein
MAQTTTSLSWENNKLEFSADGTTWTDVSGSTNSVEAEGGEVEVSKLYTHGTFAPIVGYGRPDLFKVGVNVVYTETAGEAYLLMKAAYENRTAAYFRWSPKGADAGELRYTTGIGRITAFKYPSGKAEDAAPVQMTIQLTTPSIASATV